MQRTDDKTLRHQICHSLEHIFDSISPQKNTDDHHQIGFTDDADNDHHHHHQIGYNDGIATIKPFIRQCPKDSDEEFWALYYNIFNIVEQWSQKKNCTIFCYKLIIKMMCCGNLPFYLHVLKYQPKSKSGYILPSLHRSFNNRSKNNNLQTRLSNHSSNSNLEKNKNNKLDLSALPDHPHKSPIMRFLVSNLKEPSNKPHILRIILQFIQELPEEFVTADSEWYASLLGYLKDKIINSSNPNQPQELKIIAAIFTAFGERDGKEYFVPTVQNLLTPDNLWWNQIGLETLNHAVVSFGHALSKYNFSLGACLSPLSIYIFKTCLARSCTGFYFLILFFYFILECF